MNRHQRRAAGSQQRKQDGPFDIYSREALATAAMHADHGGAPGVAELLREMMHGDLAAAFVNLRDAELDIDGLLSTARPTVVVVGDDDYSSVGPSGWRCAEALADWARCAVIHAAGASAETYRPAIDGAYLKGRAVLVETDLAHARPWGELFLGKPVLLVLPNDGPHPVTPAREEVN